MEDEDFEEEEIISGKIIRFFDLYPEYEEAEAE